ncbi:MULTISPECIES: hypothetical protein [Novacetimonas]|uniref:hypothetical protein n=1 Tax=Novacetimonas TaxID=2919364 RepID=UPI001057C745|nr:MULTISPECIES: hypothetical protein [Novacetimonas]MBV1833540.1 hypothetical protein [Novacetimonas pomaceti]
MLVKYFLFAGDDGEMPATIRIPQVRKPDISTPPAKNDQPEPADVVYQHLSDTEEGIRTILW